MSEQQNKVEFYSTPDNHVMIRDHNGVIIERISRKQYDVFRQYCAANQVGKKPACWDLIIKSCRIIDNLFPVNYNFPFQPSVYQELQVEENNIEELPTTLLTFEQLRNLIDVRRRKEYEIIMTVMCTDKEVDCPVWLTIISPPSTGKTKLLEMFDHPSISYFVDEISDNGLLAGGADMEAADRYSAFEAANHLNFIINDMSSTLSTRKEKVEKFLGALTSAYGLKYRKVSPAGLQTIETHLSVIMGITPRLYKQQRKYMAILGSRMLFMPFSRPEDLRFATILDEEYIRLNTCAFVDKIMHNDDFEPKITKDLEDIIYEFVKKVILARNIQFISSFSELEGESRLFKQLILLCKAHAKILHHDVEMADFELFKPLALKTIPYVSNIKRIVAGYSNTDNNVMCKQMISNGIKMKMVEELRREEMENRVSHMKYDKVYYIWNEKWKEFMDSIDETMEEDDEL